MNSTTNFQTSRMLNLLRFEWMNRKKMYLSAIFGMIALLIFFFQFFFYSNIGSMRWESGYYHGVFIIGLVILSFLAVGQSFLDLREKKSARLYLTLPASHLEKYTVQFLMRVLVPIIVYPLLFWLASVLSVQIFTLGDLVFSYSGESSNPEVAKLADFLKLPEGQIPAVYWLMGGLLCLIPSLMFSGGVFFGKWNFILMPLTIIAIWGFLTLSSLILSWLIYPVTVSRNGGLARIEMFNFDKPEIFPETPLAILVIIALVWAAAILAYVASYFKLTEKEV
jgi:hypothetical protein